MDKLILAVILDTAKNEQFVISIDPVDATKNPEAPWTEYIDAEKEKGIVFTVMDLTDADTALALRAMRAIDAMHDTPSFENLLKATFLAGFHAQEQHHTHLP